MGSCLSLHFKTDTKTELLLVSCVSEAKNAVSILKVAGELELKLDSPSKSSSASQTAFHTSDPSFNEWLGTLSRISDYSFSEAVSIDEFESKGEKDPDTNADSDISYKVFKVSNSTQVPKSMSDNLPTEKYCYGSLANATSASGEAKVTCYESLEDPLFLRKESFDFQTLDRKYRTGQLSTLPRNIIIAKHTSSTYASIIDSIYFDM